MTQSVPVQCPGCGWTGHESDLEEAANDLVCPVCQERVPLE